MTRETKIGLLVGLAFILIVGVLLSDHVSTAARPAEAALTHAADDARNAVRAPGAAAVVPELEPVVVPEAKDEADDARGTVLPAGLAAAVAPEPAQLPPADVVARVLPVVVDAEDAANAARDYDPADPWSRVLGGGQVSAVDDTAAAETGVRLDPSAAGDVREYVAARGDSLSRIVRRELGEDTAANRNAVMALNPRLREDPNHIVAGRTYLLPVMPSAPVPTPATQTRTERGGEYVVKPGDSLWKIAAGRAASNGEVPAMIESIKRLNRDALAGGETVRVGMTLRLP